MSDLLRRMLGEETSASSVVPVVASGNPSVLYKKPRKKDDKDDKRKAMLRSATVRSMLGEREGDSSDKEEESLFPKDAKEVDGYQQGAKGADNSDFEKRNDPTNPYKDFMLPQASLVAPDVTPDALEPLSPSEVPGASSIPVKPAEQRAEKPVGIPQDLLRSYGEQSGGMSAMDTLLGRQEFPMGNNAAMASREPNLESFKSAIGSNAVYDDAAAMAGAATAAAVVESAMVPGKEMPEHKTGNGAAISAAFRMVNG